MMPAAPAVDVAALLGRRAGVFACAATACTLPLGWPRLDVVVETDDPHEPSVWIRHEVLATFQVDGIAIGRVAGNMTDVVEIKRFPGDAIIDAAKFAVMEAISRAIGRAIETEVMELASAVGDLR